MNDNNSIQTKSSSTKEKIINNVPQAIREKLNNEFEQARIYRGSLDNEEANNQFYEIVRYLNIKKPDELIEIAKYVDNRDLRPLNLFVFNNSLIAFISKLLSGFENKDVLILGSDIGTLALSINKFQTNSLTCIAQNQYQKKSLQSLTKNTENTVSIFKKSNPNKPPESQVNKTKVINDDAIKYIEQSDQQFDLIVGTIPNDNFSKTEHKFENELTKINSSYKECLIAHSISKLKPEGKIILIVEDFFLVRKNDKSALIYNLSKLDAKLSVVLDIPPESDLFNTYIRPKLVVIEKGKQEKTMSGLYSDEEKLQTILIKNYHNKTNDNLANCGFWEKLDEFKGCHKVSLLQNMQRLAKKADLITYPMIDVVLSINIVNANKMEDFHKENSIYIPLSNSLEFVSSQEVINNKSKDYFQIVFDFQLVNADYYLYFLEYSDIGHKYKAYINQEYWFGVHITKDSILDSFVYLPPIEIQNDVIKSQTQLHELKNEINEVQNKIWKNPNKVNKLNKLIDKFNNKEGFMDWVETLPFPLASILWSYKTECNSEKERFEKLLHFFDAATQILASIHLSVLRNNDLLAEEILLKLNQQLKITNKTIKEGAFGLWVVVYEILVSSIRKKLNNDKNLIMNLYGMEDHDLMLQFINKGLITLFKEANFIRNSRLGHTGAINENTAASTHNNLSNLLSKFRALSIGIWDYYQLIIPGTTRKKGGLLSCKVKNIMGTRTPFVPNKIDINSILDEENIYLYSNISQKAIELLPFVKIMPSPKTGETVCYFYNKLLNNNKARFISYHYGNDSDIELHSDNLIKVINEIN